MKQPQQLTACFRLLNVAVSDHEVIAEGALRLVVDHFSGEDLLPTAPARHGEGHSATYHLDPARAKKNLAKAGALCAAAKLLQCSDRTLRRLAV